MLLGEGTRLALERKQAALVAWLAAHGATSRSRLAGLLWPEADDPRARGNFRQRLSKLRQAAGLLIDDEDGLLVLAGHVEVDAAPPGAQWLDGASFDDCADFRPGWTASAKRNAPCSARRCSPPSATRPRAVLSIAPSRKPTSCAIDRESEEAYRVLMEVLYLRGDRAAAIGVWDRCREMLRSFYGVVPTVATQRLGQTILDAAAAAAVPARPSNAIPVTVPRPLRLVGRDGLVATMLAAWQLGHAVCVSGEAGVDKSRLLAEFVAALGPCATASARPGDGLLPFASLSRLVLAALDHFEPARGGATYRCTRLLPQIAPRLGVTEPAPLRTAHERGRARLMYIVESLNQAFEESMEQGTTLSLVIDGAQAEGSHLLLNRLRIQYFSLFEGTPEEGLLEIAPLLVPVNEVGDNALRAELFSWAEDLAYRFPMVSWVSSVVGATDLASHLRRFHVVGLSEGQSMLMRWYDTRILPVWFACLTAPQMNAFAASALEWHYVDRSGAVVNLFRGSKPTLVVVPPAYGAPVVVLDDVQLAVLISAADLDVMLARLRRVIPDEVGQVPKATLAAFVSHYMQSAVDAGLNDIDRQAQYVLLALYTSGKGLDQPEFKAFMNKAPPSFAEFADGIADLPDRVWKSGPPLWDARSPAATNPKMLFGGKAGA